MSRKPSFQGSSVGHWEGDTLVVEVTNFNGKPWLGTAQPPDRLPQTSSDALHIVERWSRPDAQIFEYRVVVEDPKMLTAPWTGSVDRRGILPYRHGPGITLLPGSRVGRATPGICRRASKEEGRSPMSRRAMAVVAGAVVVGAALLAGVWVAVDDNGATEGAATGTGSFTAKTGWGEPNLTGVWRATALGAGSGRDTFNLAKLEGLVYARGARTDEGTLGERRPNHALHSSPFSTRRDAGAPGPDYSATWIRIRLHRGVSGLPDHSDDRKAAHFAPQYLFPTHMGDSTARWEGDTLVVDVISFNGEGWLASPQDRPTNASTGVWLTSDAMHVIERWRRIDADTLEYQATVEDPKTLTMPWETPTVTFTRQTVDRIEEVSVPPGGWPGNVSRAPRIVNSSLAGEPQSQF